VDKWKERENEARTYLAAWCGLRFLVRRAATAILVRSRITCSFLGPEVGLWEIRKIPINHVSFAFR